MKELIPIEADNLPIEVEQSAVPIPAEGKRLYITQDKDNSTEMFVQSLFPDKFKDIVTQCFLDNNESFAKLFNDPDFYQKVQEAMATELYKALRKE